MTVKNHSSQKIYIEGDPNWDDQILLLNNKRVHRLRTLGPKQSVQLERAWG